MAKNIDDIKAGKNKNLKLNLGENLKTKNLKDKKRLKKQHGVNNDSRRECYFYAAIKSDFACAENNTKIKQD